MVSTVVVDGRRFATSTGMNRPVLESRPILVGPFPGIALYSFQARRTAHEPIQLNHSRSQRGRQAKVVTNHREHRNPLPHDTREGGVLLAEIGWDEGERVQEVARECFPGARVAVKKDLAGLDRLLVVES